MLIDISNKSIFGLIISAIDTTWKDEILLKQFSKGQKIKYTIFMIWWLSIEAF